MFDSENTLSSFFSHIPWSVVGIILSIVVLVVVGVYTYQTYTKTGPEPENNPNSEYGNSAISQQDAEMCFFYADWCPHCKVAMQEWNQVKSEYDGRNINGYTVRFTEYNCSESTPELVRFMDENNISGFPTIKLNKGGNWIEFQARPSRETLEKFINTAV